MRTPLNPTLDLSAFAGVVTFKLLMSSAVGDNTNSGGKVVYKPHLISVCGRPTTISYIALKKNYPFSSFVKHPTMAEIFSNFIQLNQEIYLRYILFPLARL